jgi:hypothetical protein
MAAPCCCKRAEIGFGPDPAPRRNGTQVNGHLDRKTRRLIAARAVRSIAQGALVVDFTLYLRALAWPAIWIGVLFAVGMVVNIALTLVLGPLSDRLGRKRFLLAYEAMQMAAAAVALATTSRSGSASPRSSAPPAAVPTARPGRSARSSRPGWRRA